jgi:hypothetical protein
MDMPQHILDERLLNQDNRELPKGANMEFGCIRERVCTYCLKQNICLVKSHWFLETCICMQCLKRYITLATENEH